MELAGRVAIVTGGAVRVGRALSLALAAAGCRVLVHFGKSAAAAEQVRAEVARRGGEAAVHSADLADPEAARGVVAAAAAAFGPASILVNNAALFLPGDLAATDLASWEAQFAVNLRAPFLLSQAFVAALPAGAEGQIVNVLDARTRRPAGDYFAYRLTKAALAAMTEMLARDLAPRARVNGLALGAILPPPGAAAAFLDRIARERVPLGRPGTPDAVAASLLHLLQQDFATGVVLRLDGGEYL